MPSLTSSIARLAFVLVLCLSAGTVGWAQSDTVHTPAAGSAERKTILDTLRAEYTTGSGANVKFVVKHFKVHGGWAWINVVPQNPRGEAEGDEWPSLLRLSDGKWTIIDLIAIAQPFSESEGPSSPSARFLKAIQKKYPTVPSDIFPPASK